MIANLITIIGHRLRIELFIYISKNNNKGKSFYNVLIILSYMTEVGSISRKY